MENYFQNEDGNWAKKTGKNDGNKDVSGILSFGGFGLAIILIMAFFSGVFCKEHTAHLFKAKSEQIKGPKMGHEHEQTKEKHNDATHCRPIDRVNDIFGRSSKENRTENTSKNNQRNDEGN